MGKPAGHKPHSHFFFKNIWSFAYFSVSLQPKTDHPCDGESGF
jgi:hypothetical protein